MVRQEGTSLNSSGTSGYSAKISILPSGKVATSEHTQSPSTSGESLESEYSNVAPDRSTLLNTPASSIVTVPFATEVSLIKTETPLAIEIVSPCGPDQSATFMKEISGGSGSSRHLFKIKNASSHEVMFILYGHIIGARQAMNLAAKLGWLLQRPLQELFAVIDELDRNCNARSAKRKRLATD